MIRFKVLLFVCVHSGGGSTIDERRLIGGAEVNKPTDFPFMAYVWESASLKLKKNVNITGIGSTCGGTILSQTHILTAAHCVTECVTCACGEESCVTCVLKNNRSFRVLTGAMYPKRAETMSRVKKVHVHPEYRLIDNIHKCYFRHDIAVLELLTPLKFSCSVSSRPIKLPEAVNIEEDTSKSITSQLRDKHGECIVIGWGSSNQNKVKTLMQRLKYAQTRLIRTEDCVSQLKVTNKGFNNYENYGLCVGSNICTSDEGHHNGICFGDSGGPLVCREVLMGVVSWSPSGAMNCAGKNVPDVYSRVDVHVGWIRSVISKKKVTNSTEWKPDTDCDYLQYSFSQI